MSKTSYPTIFHEDGNNSWVEFPDLEGCLSSGDSIETAFENAKEALVKKLHINYFFLDTFLCLFFG